MQKALTVVTHTQQLPLHFKHVAKNDAIGFINCIKQICAFVGHTLTVFLQAMSASPRLSSRGRLTWWMLFSEFDLRSLRSSPTSVPKSTDYYLQRDAHRDTPSKACCNLLWQYHYLGSQYFSTSQRGGTKKITTSLDLKICLGAIALLEMF